VDDFNITKKPPPDILACVDKILPGEEFVIPVNRQMIVHGVLVNEGLLIIEGTLVGIG